MYEEETRIIEGINKYPSDLSCPVTLYKKKNLLKVAEWYYKNIKPEGFITDELKEYIINYVEYQSSINLSTKYLSSKLKGSPKFYIDKMKRIPKGYAKTSVGIWKMKEE